MSKDQLRPKRLRGRPLGSGKDDAPQLAIVADMLVAKPNLKPTTAIKQSVKGIQDSHLRRLQEKWRTGGDGHLTAARARQKQAAQDMVEGQAAKALRTAMNDPTLRAWQGLGRSAAQQAAIDYPELQMWQASATGPAVKEMLAMFTSPAGQEVQRWANNPAVKEALGLIDHQAVKEALGLVANPVLQQVLDHQEMVASAYPFLRRGR